jgi:hypothetical protein
VLKAIHALLEKIEDFSWWYGQSIYPKRTQAVADEAST